VPDRHDLADRRVLPLDRVLDVGGGHVLAGRADDDLAFAVDDGQVTVLVQLADVAGMEPAIGVERLGGLLGLLAVADEVQGGPEQALAVVGEPQLHAWERLARGPALELLDPVEAVEAALGETVGLEHRAADRAEELRELGSARGTADESGANAVETELGE